MCISYLCCVISNPKTSGLQPFYSAHDLWFMNLRKAQVIILGLSDSLLIHVASGEAAEARGSTSKMMDSFPHI